MRYILKAQCLMINLVVKMRSEASFWRNFNTFCPKKCQKWKFSIGFCQFIFFKFCENSQLSGPAWKMFWVIELQIGLILQEKNKFVSIEYSRLTGSFTKRYQKILSAKNSVFWPFFDEKSYFSQIYGHNMVSNPSIFWKFNLIPTHFHLKWWTNDNLEGAIFFSHSRHTFIRCILKRVLCRKCFTAQTCPP